MFNCCDLRPNKITIYDPRREAQESQLIPGPKGDSVYLHIGWADSLLNGEPVGFSLTQDGTKDWFAFYQTTDSDYIPTASDFENWKSVRGPQGESNYVLPLYADDANGTNRSLVPTGKDYIAVVTLPFEPFDLSEIPVQATDGKWRKFTGSPTYVYIAYATSQTGDNLSLVPQPNTTHIALRYSSTPLNPNLQSTYTGLWKNYIGAKGDKGDPGDRYKTSTSSQLLTSTGTKSLTVGSNLAWTAGQPISITNLSAGLHGKVLSYTPSTGDMTIDVQIITGSGTHTNWVVNLGSFISSSVWTQSGNGIHYTNGNVAVGQDVDNTELVPGQKTFQVLGAMVLNSSPIYFMDDPANEGYTTNKISWLIRAQKDRFQIFSNRDTTVSTTIPITGRTYNAPGDDFTATDQSHQFRVELNRDNSNNIESLRLFNDHNNATREYGIELYNNGLNSSINPFKLRYRTPGGNNDVFTATNTGFTFNVPVTLDDDLVLDKVKPASGVKVLTIDDTGLVGVDNLLSVPDYTLDDVTTNGAETTNSIIVGGLQVNGVSDLDNTITEDLTVKGTTVLQTLTPSVTTSNLLGSSPNGTLRSISLGTGLTLDNNVLNTIPYSLPIASTSVLGGIRVGNSLSISNDGILNYNLPTATGSVKGGVRIGSGLSIINSDQAKVFLSNPNIPSYPNGTFMMYNNTEVNGVSNAPINYYGTSEVLEMVDTSVIRVVQVTGGTMLLLGATGNKLTPGTGLTDVSIGAVENGGTTANILLSRNSTGDQYIYLNAVGGIRTNSPLGDNPFFSLERIDNNSSPQTSNRRIRFRIDGQTVYVWGSTDP